MGFFSWHGGRRGGSCAAAREISTHFLPFVVSTTGHIAPSPSLAHVKDGGEGFFLSSALGFSCPTLFSVSSHSQVPAAAASHSIGGAALRKKSFKKRGSYGQPCLTRERPRSCLVSTILGRTRGKRGEGGNLKWDDGTKGVSATQSSGKPSGDSGFSLSTPLAGRSV